MIKSITPADAKKLLAENPAAKLLDVREQWEFDIVKIEGSVHYPLSTFMKEIQNLPKDGDYFLLCHHGSRSLNACAYMSMNGFSNLYNVEGGIDAWAYEVDTTLAKY